MNRLFQQIVGMKPKRNAFDLSHERKFSMNMGQLVPILCEEVVPGDTFQINTEVLLRFAPMLAPVMHRINVYTHYFFVPNRLVWDNWEDFITGGKNGDADPAFPQQNVGTSSAGLIGLGTLWDYMGASTPIGAMTIDARANALPFRAYQTIYNEYYRDQNLEDEIPVPKTDGLDSTATMITLRTRAWEKDYFTSALPWTQRGGDVSIPLTGNADVVLKDPPHGGVVMVRSDGSWSDLDESLETEGFAGTSPSHVVNTSNNLENLSIDPAGTLEADMSTVSAATIEELRRATKLQQYLERNARTGSRYIEQILGRFGVKSSDARLQRPEYLGGGKSPVTISEVLQTSGIQDVSGDVINTTPLGEMAGHGVAVGNSHRCKKFFEEHGYVIGIISVLPKTAYMQGTRKHFLKEDKFDFFTPEFAQLGEEPVDIRELYDDYTMETGEETFGYQSRYSFYKYVPSSVHGDFKENLKYWHMARDFDSKPVLNNDFVKSDPTNRIFNVLDPSVTKLYVQVYNNLKAIRPIPKFNNPSLI